MSFSSCLIKNDHDDPCQRLKHADSVSHYTLVRVVNEFNQNSGVLEILPEICSSSRTEANLNKCIKGVVACFEVSWLSNLNYILQKTNFMK